MKPAKGSLSSSQLFVTSLHNFYSRRLQYVFLFELNRKDHLLNLHFLCEGYFGNWSSANRNFTKPV